MFLRDEPQGFFVYVEFRIGISGRQIGTSTFNSVPGDPDALPDFQIVARNPLGNGSVAVCDDGSGIDPIGGVPGTDPPVFGGTQESADAINDLSCRFDARGSGETGPCTRDELGDFAMASPESAVQFCTSSGVGAEIAFPLGDTLLTARGRDSPTIATPTPSS